MIDTHCHLQFRAYKNDVEKVVERCQKKRVLLMNVVGSQRSTSEKAVRLAEKYPNIFATVGLHPVHTASTEVDEEEAAFQSREEKFDYEFYKTLANHPKVVAIGECGIELFHLPKDADRKTLVQRQTESFLAQAKLAQELDLPLVIHVRDAYEEMLGVLKTLPFGKGGRSARIVTPARHSPEAKPMADGQSVAGGEGVDRRGVRGVIHCYSGNWLTARKFLDLGLYLGFTAVITFPPKKTNPEPSLDLLEVVKRCPLDKILIETDAPYLAPQKYRGQRCEPWMVEEIIKKVAEIKKINFEEAERITDENAKRLFIPTPNL